MSAKVELRTCALFPFAITCLCGVKVANLVDIVLLLCSRQFLCVLTNRLKVDAERAIVLRISVLPCSENSRRRVM